MESSTFPQRPDCASNSRYGRVVEKNPPPYSPPPPPIAEDQNMIEDQLRICKEVFGSRKAVGGRLWSHVHAHPNSLHPKKMKNNNATVAATVIEGPGAGDNNHGAVREDRGGHVCPVCDKYFWSKKSLFGHMRCHPNRPWRGIRPPSASTSLEAIRRNCPSSTPSSDAPIGKNHRHIDILDHQIIDSAAAVPTATPVEDDLSELLRSPGWSKTDTRGQRKGSTTATAVITTVAPAADPSVSPPSSPRGFQLELDEVEAMGDVMLLAQGLLDHETTNSSNLARTEASVQRTRSETDRHHNQLEKGMDEDESSSFNTKTRSEPDRHQDQLDYDTEQSESKIDNLKNEKMLRTRSLGRVLSNIAILPPPPPPPPTFNGVATETEALSERFNCGSCNRSFAFQKALDDHALDHNTQNRLEQATGEKAQPPVDETEDRNIDNDIPILHLEAEGEQNCLEPAAGATQHLCSICNKAFSAGQALGSHMRSHYNSRPPTEAASSSAASPPINCTSSGGRASLNIDLNSPNS